MAWMEKTNMKIAIEKTWYTKQFCLFAFYLVKNHRIHRDQMLLTFPIMYWKNRLTYLLLSYSLKRFHIRKESHEISC